ncbi:MAG: hypothetical protein HUU29_04640 [Planctomycetaceae bacterium]|nr:hypothetical protein [Planctomycetaceae bacterium]
MKVMKSLAMVMVMALTLGAACLTDSSTVNAGICTGHQGQKLLSSGRRAVGTVVNAPNNAYIGATVYMFYSKYSGMIAESVLSSYLVTSTQVIRLPDLCTYDGAPLTRPDFRFFDVVTGTNIDTTRPANQDQYLGFGIGTLTLNIA